MNKPSWETTFMYKDSLLLCLVLFPSEMDPLGDQKQAFVCPKELLFIARNMLLLGELPYQTRQAQ